MSYRNYAPGNSHIVDPSGNGDFTTIQSAITSAVSGQTIFINPGTYTENLTLKVGVTLAAFNAGGVTIVGKATFSGSGSTNLRNIALQTNSDFALVVSGANPSVINLTNCSLGCTNNTGISFTNSNASSLIYLENCIIDLQTTGIAYFSSSSAGVIQILKSQLTNTGASSTASTISSGVLSIQRSGISAPITVSSTGIINSSFNGYTTGALNVTTLNIQSNAGSAVNFDSVSSGTAQAITVTGGNQLVIRNCDILSTNAVQVGGAGTIVLDRASLGTSTSLIAPTTLTPAYVQSGITRSTNQPAFLAYVTNVITNVTGDGTNYTLIPDTESFDQNSDFNLGTGTFTAPVSGKYAFEFAGQLQGATAFTAATMSIQTTSKTFTKAMALGITITGCSGTIAVTTDMASGDTAIFTIQASDTGGKVDDVTGSSSGIRNWVSGCLVC